MIKNLNEIPEEEYLTGGSGACAGCPAETGLRLALKVLGKDTVVVNASGCMTLLVVYPHTPLKISWMHNAIENAAPTAGAIARALKIRNRKMNVVCYAGDGATYDIGFAPLSAAMLRKDPFLYICYNNQVYGNTGAQWATSTPKFAETKTTPLGNREREKDMMKLMKEHGVYCATASIAYPIDYMNKIEKAMKMLPAYIELLSPCVPAWGYPSNKTISIAKMSVMTGVWPLYEYYPNEKMVINYKPDKFLPVEEYLKLTDRYNNIKEVEIKEIQKQVDEKWRKLLKEEKCINE